jgi:hypothetical protein
MAQFLLLRLSCTPESAFVKLNYGGASLAGKGPERFEIVALATTSAKAINTSTSTSDFKIRLNLRPLTIHTNPQHNSQ